MESQNQLPSTQVLSKGTTFTRTCINGINILAGVGILSVPFALAQGGWLSLIFLFILAATCGYTGILLKRCMDENPSVRSYPDIGELAFGLKGKILVSIFVYLELYLLAVEYLILEGDNLQNLFPSHGFKIGSVRVGGKEMYMVCTAAVMMPTTWLRSLGLLAYVSFGGVLALIVLISCVAWTGVADGFGSNQGYDLFRIQGLPTSLSLMGFCYCGHAVFPMLCNSMKNKAQFPKVLLVCFTVTTASYGSIAVLGYLMYGKNIKSQVTLNLPIDRLSSKIAIYTTLINPLTKYAATTNPVAIAIEDAFSFATTRRSMAILIRTLLLITALIVALSVPLFAYVMAFMGAFLGVATTILIPCLCYLKINKHARKFGLELVVIVGILVMGVSVCILGTFSSVKEIVKCL